MFTNVSKIQLGAGMILLLSICESASDPLGYAKEEVTSIVKYNRVKYVKPYHAGYDSKCDNRFEQGRVGIVHELGFRTTVGKSSENQFGRHIWNTVPHAPHEKMKLQVRWIDTKKLSSIIRVDENCFAPVNPENIIRPGVYVKLENLKKASYNGKVGVVNSYNEGSDRWNVKVAEDLRNLKLVALKVENLVALPLAPTDPAEPKQLSGCLRGSQVQMSSTLDALSRLEILRNDFIASKITNGVDILKTREFLLQLQRKNENILEKKSRLLDLVRRTYRRRL